MRSEVEVAVVRLQAADGSGGRGGAGEVRAGRRAAHAGAAHPGPGGRPRGPGGGRQVHPGDGVPAGGDHGRGHPPGQGEETCSTARAAMAGRTGRPPPSQAVQCLPQGLRDMVQEAYHEVAPNECDRSLKPSVLYPDSVQNPATVAADHVERAGEQPVPDVRADGGAPGGGRGGHGHHL